MSNLINSFMIDENGAVTVDWVVLTAAIVGIAILIISVIQVSLLDASFSIADAIAPQETFDCTATIINGTATLVGPDC